MTAISLRKNYECEFLEINLINDYRVLAKLSACLGCKRSWVQIPPVRPIYLREIFKFTYEKYAFFYASVNALLFGIYRHLSGFITKPLRNTSLLSEIRGILGGIIMGLVRYNIINWEKFNARPDRANYSWFRFQNGFFEDHKIFGLSDSQITLFIYLLCESSKKNSGSIDINIEYVSAIRKTSISKISNDLNALVDHGVIKTADSRHDAVKEPSLSPATYIQTDRHNRHTDTNAQSFDFARVYFSYPRKVGKEKGLAICRREVKTQADYDALTAAVAKYADYVRREKTDPKYIKHFSTFMGSWRDWLDQDAGTSSANHGPRPIEEILADEGAI